MYKHFFKRLLDIAVASTLLLLFLPFGIFIIILILLTTNDRPFFTQLRIGKDEKIFKVLKFKTMNDDKDASGELLLDKYRTTKVGAILRKCSLDELPQLINVLKGEMSLIGPRPLLITYLPYYTSTERLRHTIRPGISGLAQVNGRNNTNWETRLGYDVYYAKNITFLMDVGILLKTIKNIILTKDIEVNPQAAMLKLNEARKELIHEN